jgi:hypothetical protein
MAQSVQSIQSKELHRVEINQCNKLQYTWSYLVASAMHSSEGELGVGELGEVSSLLLAHLVRLPTLASHTVTKIPDPRLGSLGGADTIIVTRENENVQTEFSIDQIVVNGGHRMHAIRLLVSNQHGTMTIKLSRYTKSTNIQ